MYIHTYIHTYIFRLSIVQALGTLDRTNLNTSYMLCIFYLASELGKIKIIKLS
jgi:hypothetical protein